MGTKISRRKFLESSLALGLTGALAACTPAPTAAPTTAPASGGVVPENPDVAKAIKALNVPVIANGHVDGGWVDTSKFKKPGPYRIGFSFGMMANIWRILCATAAKQWAEANSDKIKQLIIVDGQGDANKQVGDIENLIAQKVDAIMLIAQSPTAVVPALKKATAAGIVTLPFNLSLQGEGWLGFVGTELKNRGKQFAEGLVAAMGGKGRIIALGGIPGNDYTATMWKAAQDVFAGKPIEVLAYKDCDWQVAKCKATTADLLAAFPEIDGIWADSGESQGGILQAFIAANRPLVPTCGDDYNGYFKIFDQYKDKHPKFDIASVPEPTCQSMVVLEIIMQALQGKPIPKNWVIDCPLITKANYGDYIRRDLPDDLYLGNGLNDKWLKKVLDGTWKD